VVILPDVCYKMISIQELHRQAMDMAEMALMAKHQGKLDKADDFFDKLMIKKKNLPSFLKRFRMKNRLARFSIEVPLLWHYNVKNFGKQNVL